MRKFEKNVDDFKEETFCALCLSVLSDGNFTVVEETMKGILDILFLTPNVEDANISTVCNACSVKLFAAFDFKTKCVETEDCIFAYVSSEEKVDLREVYLNERGKEHLRNLSEDYKVCRLCMQTVTSGFIPLKEVDVDTFRGYIPEVNFNSTKEPVICIVCLELLDTHTIFLKSCLDIKEKIKDFYDGKGSKSLSNIKQEEIEIKSEETDDSDIQYYNPHDELDSTKTVIPEVTEQEIKDSCTTDKFSVCSEPRCNTNDETVDAPKVIVLEISISNPCIEAYEGDGSKYENVSKKQPYKCPKCEFETPQKAALNDHHWVHHRNETYRCEKCSYSSKWPCLFIRHMLWHDSCKYVHKCNQCDFSTLKRSTLRGHLKRHATKKFKCGSCNFETIYEKHLESHAKMHQSSSKTPTYKCDIPGCKFKTAHKSNVRTHQLRHHKLVQLQETNAQI